MASQPSSDRSLTLKQAAILARVSVRTIYNRIADGTLQTTRAGVSQRITLESMETWLTHRKERKTYGQAADRSESGE